MPKTIYLYLKTHNQTGLKYLGSTTCIDPYKYKGSGLHWKRHIKKHGNDVSTKILYQTRNEDDFYPVCLFYSKVFNVTDSDNFANLMAESGRPGLFKHHSELSKQRISDFGKTKTFSKQTRERISISNTGKRRSPEVKLKMSIKAKNRSVECRLAQKKQYKCSCCEFTSTKSHISRHIAKHHQKVESVSVPVDIQGLQETGSKK